ncbi:MAG TPA: hypothetical protein VGH19_24110 [Verrucomicrobiae bacterium]
MSGITLSIVSREFPKWRVSIGGEGSLPLTSDNVVRSSLIYPLDAAAYKPLDLQDGQSFLWFGFTVHSFQCIATVKREMPAALATSFTSHGFASLIFHTKTQSEIEKLKGLIEKYLIGEELWNIKDGIIESSESLLAERPKWNPVELHLNLHSKDDYVIFRDLGNSLESVGPELLRITEEHAQMGGKIAKLSSQLSINILYLQGKISETDYNSYCGKIFHDDSEIAQLSIKQLKHAKLDAQRTTVAIHQYRDEAIQVAAILQSIFQQGISGLAPLLTAPYQVGTFSLLGIGGVYAALLALYSHVRKVFTAVQPEKVVAVQFPKTKSPSFPSKPTEYEKWRNTLKDYSGVTGSQAEGVGSPAFFHLLYFSNRLGFRATKLSITAAYQSICLGLMPSWNVSTIFHEFLHAHVKALLTEVFPLDEAVFQAAYENYRVRRTAPDQSKYLTPFIQTLILHVVSSLYFSNGDRAKEKANEYKISDCLDPKTLQKELLRHHDQIDELFVHILDLNYFYDCDTETYIRSIWSSWLTLPFITKRLGEYALRTICATASIDDGRQIERFNRALKKLKEQLGRLSGYDFIDENLLKEVVQFLENDDNVADIRNRFFVLCPLIDVIAEFFVFGTIQPQLVREVSDVLKGDDYTYEFKAGEYLQDVIESPVKFLTEQLKHSLNKWEPNLPSEKAEFLTLWSFQAISSTLTLVPYENKRQK